MPVDVFVGLAPTAADRDGPGQSARGVEGGFEFRIALEVLVDAGFGQAEAPGGFVDRGAGAQLCDYGRMPGAIHPAVAAAGGSEGGGESGAGFAAVVHGVGMQADPCARLLNVGAGPHLLEKGRLPVSFFSGHGLSLVVCDEADAAEGAPVAVAFAVSGGEDVGAIGGAGDEGGADEVDAWLRVGQVGGGGGDDGMDGHAVDVAAVGEAGVEAGHAVGIVGGGQGDGGVFVAAGGVDVERLCGGEVSEDAFQVLAGFECGGVSWLGLFLVDKSGSE